MPDDTNFELNPRKSAVYRVVAGLLTGLSWLMFRPTVTGASNIPLEGPVIIAPIHRSNVDFAFTLFISPRKVFFMAKEPLFRQPLFGRLLRHLGAFPLRRGTTDRDSMALAERVLREGQALVMFPEGTRRQGRDVAALHDGVMFMAARTGASVVPVGIGGSERAMPVGHRMLRPAKIRVVVGAPLTSPTSEGRVARTQITEKTEQLRRALEAVYHESLG